MFWRSTLYCVTGRSLSSSRHVYAFVGDGEVIIVLENEQVVLTDRADAVRGGATLSDARKALRLADTHFAELLVLWEKMHA